MLLVGPDFKPVHSTDHPLDGFSGLALAVFVIVSGFCIQAVQIPLPLWFSRLASGWAGRLRIVDRQTQHKLAGRQWRFPLDLRTAPFIGLLVLLATTAADGETIKRGIVGDASMRPYDVLVLFISLAYLSIALDGTGALESLALWVSKKAGPSGRKLFFVLYAFFFVLACIVGNDPLILSGTPFLSYLVKHGDLPSPLPLVFAEFITANTGSAVLVSSNPTNVLLTGSFGLNFLTGFTKYTVLPSFIAVLATLPILLLIFWKKIPATIVPVTANPKAALIAPLSALFFTTLLIVTIAVLIGTSFASADVHVWMVTAPAGVLGLAYSLFSDIFLPPIAPEPAQTLETIDAPESSRDPSARKSPHANEERGVNGSDGVAEKDEGVGKQASESSQDGKTLLGLLRALRRRFPRTALTVERLPIPLLPFAMCQFILVRALLELGWIRVFASGFIRACQTPVQAAFFTTVVTACFLCPFAGTNIGATILMVEILRDSRFAGAAIVHEDARILPAAILGVAMGSNLGAFSYTFAASLAGLLWRMLLDNKGIRVRQRTFAAINFTPLCVQVILAAAFIVLEVYYFM